MQISTVVPEKQKLHSQNDTYKKKKSNIIIQTLIWFPLGSEIASDAVQENIAQGSKSFELKSADQMFKVIRPEVA